MSEMITLSIQSAAPALLPALFVVKVASGPDPAGMGAPLKLKPTTVGLDVPADVVIPFTALVELAKDRGTKEPESESMKMSIW